MYFNVTLKVKEFIYIDIIKAKNIDSHSHSDSDRKEGYVFTLIITIYYHMHYVILE